MAPIKRSRVDQHYDPSSSALRKKVRTSDVLTARRASDSDSDSDDDAANSSNSDMYDSAAESASERNGADPAHTPNGPAFESDSQLVEPDLDEDAIERRASQYIQKKFLQNIENVPAEHGIIERVDCYNFMCHEHFSVDLGPLINFIVGKNGSGKSAILTALTLCLGGKASVTNRGQSLKSFIKEGKDSATIVVRIKNQGDSAYNPNEFGNSIIIERHFSRNGSSGFKIKSSSGRVVSTKKSELDSITDYFALQIDNPMNVLSQDMARQFLSSSSPSEKYKFFVKGVQLEQLDQDYRLLEESIDQTEAKLSIHLDQIKDLETNRNNARAKLALSDKNETMRARVRNLRAQMAWVQVEEQEKNRDAYDAQLAEATRKIADLESEVAKADELYQSADREYGIAAEAVLAAKSELEAQADRGKVAKESMNEIVKERRELQATQRTIRECLKTAESAIAETERKINEEKKRIEDLDGGNHARRLAELEQRKSQAEEALNTYNAHRKDVNRLQDDINNAEREYQGKREPVNKQRSDIEQTENRLRSLTRDRGQQQNGFHEKMPMLLRAIEQEQYKFSRKPVGPLGNHIRLLKPKWSGVLESSLGANLTGFVVTAKSDSNILSSIMKRVGCECPIFIGNDIGNMDTSPNEPDPQFDTMLRVLEIDNDLVRRQLVITNGIEQVLLIENLEDASVVMFDGERPRNVRRCLCIDQRDRRRGIHLSYSRTGEPTQSPVQAYLGRPRMKTDIESQIKIQQDAVSRLKQDLLELETQERLARNHLEKCKQAVVRHSRQQEQLKIAWQQAEDRVEELQSAIDGDATEDGKLDALQTSLQEHEGEKRTHESSFEDSVNKMDSIMETLKEKKREVTEIEMEIAEYRKKVEKLEAKESKTLEKRRKALVDKNVVIDKLESLKGDKAHIVRKRQELGDIILDFTAKASSVSPRVAVSEGETANSLDKKLVRLKRDLDRFDKDLGDREKIATEAAEAEEKYESARRQVAELEELAQRFKITLNNRRKRWENFRSLITAQAKLQFTYLLSERSFRGQILSDHTKKLLDVHVEPDITKESAKGRNARTLSGGEKSFSQICLLLSLWEAMGSPIRCLDEFDVYMDSINRRMSIEMLMIAARRSVGRQFIFITPGARHEIQPAPDVRIKELAEPERGQTTLPFA
ncbi:DNA repair protein [Histoplasma capsulatum G186AR]|uniref:DNA repair protein n=2 Tax=Ajellomyces capsulatus TaxID=5037 RepID=C0NZA8_AJECG|nr:DNA repair protein [Histoplasma capsulatum G186AR]EEH03156.1 DNA repair protein [Histoplasma capsulatum G186AR]KAG5290441.1 DNA repair protein [Histoplasma capsulatum]QSS72369.1 DNA repair protein [Histoplasma capsulatum G186AR]